MERFEIELLASGEIPERTRAVGEFVAYFDAWIKPEWGNANGPIESSVNPPGLQRPGRQKPEAFQHILVNIAPRAKHLLAEFFGLVSQELQHEYQNKQGHNDYRSASR